MELNHSHLSHHVSFTKIIIQWPKIIQRPHCEQLYFLTMFLLYHSSKKAQPHMGRRSVFVTEWNKNLHKFLFFAIFLFMSRCMRSFFPFSTFSTGGKIPPRSILLKKTCLDSWYFQNLEPQSGTTYVDSSTTLAGKNMCLWFCCGAFLLKNDSFFLYSIL